jgi:hypothetical protein
MKKDKSIIDLISKVKLYSNIDSLNIIDYWEGDLFAIGFTKGNKLVYISTFDNFSETIQKYYYEFEILTNQIDVYSVVKTGDGVTFPELITEMKSFLS